MAVVPQTDGVKKRSRASPLQASSRDDHVRDRDGNKHDIVVLGHNVAQVHAQLEVYGVDEAVSTQG